MTVLELYAPQEEDLQRAEIFSTGDIAALLNVSTDEVRYWIERKLLRSSIRKAARQGSRRLFNRSDLRQAFLVQKLRSAQWKPRQIANALEAIAVALQNPASLHTPILVHEGNALLIVCRTANHELILLDAANPSQYVMVIALETLEEETRQRLALSK